MDEENPKYKNIKMMMDSFDTFLVALMVIFAIFIGSFAGSHEKQEEVDELGQMICNERSQGENYTLSYNSFEQESKTVVCKIEYIQSYDGGNVKIKNGE